MRINILTQPLYLNYGGILQNYALQEVLRRMGHETLTLNVPPRAPGKNVVWKDLIKSGINLYKKVKGIYPYPYLSPYKNFVRQHEFSKPLGKFIEDHIAKVDVNAPFTSQTATDYPADAWIVGSDQVWRPWCSPYIENCFLDFIPDDGTKRIAYAASFGTDKWEISPEKTEIIEPLAKKFDDISVREDSGVKLAKEYLNVDTTHVLDPTLLLSAEDYMALIPKEFLKKDGLKLTTYILDPNPEKVKEVKKMEKQFRFKAKKAGKMHKERLESVEEWLADFVTADYIITDSFHGTAFSIIFDKPFKVLNNPLRGNARIESLLSLIPNIPNEDGFNVNLDTQMGRIKELKEISLNWLKNSFIN